MLGTVRSLKKKLHPEQWNPGRTKKGGGGQKGQRRSVEVGWGRLGSVGVGSDWFGSVRIGSDRFGCTGPASERILVPGRTPSGPQRAVRMRQGRCGSLRIAADRADGCLENLVGAGVCLNAPNRPNDTKETFTWTSRTFK